MRTIAVAGAGWVVGTAHATRRACRGACGSGDGIAPPAIALLLLLIVNDSSIELLAAKIRTFALERAPGTRLPSSRALVAEHTVSPVTVSRAMALLAAEGIVDIRPGSGTFVGRRRSTPILSADRSWQTAALSEHKIDAGGVSFIGPADEGAVVMSEGFPHLSLLPVGPLGAALARAARRPETWSRPPVSGLRALRTWFANRSASGFEPDEVIITPGGQAAISTAIRAVVAPGEPLLTDSPTYGGATAIARAAGIRVVPLPTDERGMDPAVLAAGFARTGARAVYCQPLFQNPTGVTLDAERRAGILAAATAAGAFVIEDDFARDLAHDQAPPRPLAADDDAGRVVYLTSLTKVTSPSLRIGAIAGRGPVLARLRALRVVDDMFVARPVQEATLELVSRPAWPRHLKTFGDRLGERKRCALGALTDSVPGASVPLIPDGGMYLWVRLPDHCDDEEVARSARDEGVLVVPGSRFFPAEAPAPFLRLVYGAPSGEAQIVEGMRRLGRAVGRSC